MKRGLFITGTDTDVGKTLISAMICSALQTSGGSAGYFKPVQAGADDDSEWVWKMAALEAEGRVEPVYRFKLAAAPSRAARAERAEVSVDALLTCYRALGRRKWVVEGAGGLLVPLNDTQSILDLVKLLNLPLLVVASTRLGTINHTLLTLKAARAAEITVAGLVLNGAPDPGLKETLAQFDPVPVVAEIPPLTAMTPVSLAKTALDHFSPRILSQLFGQITGVVAVP